MSVSLVDAPFQLSGQQVTAVTLGIDAVQVIGSGGKVPVATFNSPDVVNLLNLTAQSPLVFPSATIPAGSYQQIRLLLDATTTTITVGGTTLPLKVPSATGLGFGGNSSVDSGDGVGTAGVKVNVNFTAAPGNVEAFSIDFNAQQSIVEEGNGSFIMKPVLVATATNIAGSLSGTVMNNANQPVVNAEVEALNGSTVVNTGVTDANGNFTINALPAGSYTLEILNSYTTAAGTAEAATGADETASVTVNSTFTVTAGQNTSAGTLAD
ncbi:MAG: DUF4382 domain-containing protein [Candidatus Xenobia bacterium]